MQNYMLIIVRLHIRMDISDKIYEYKDVIAGNQIKLNIGRSQMAAGSTCCVQPLSSNLLKQRVVRSSFIV